MRDEERIRFSFYEILEVFVSPLSLDVDSSEMAGVATSFEAGVKEMQDCKERSLTALPASDDKRVPNLSQGVFL